MQAHCKVRRLVEQYRRRIRREPEALEKLARKLNRQSTFHLEGDEYKRSKGECSELLKPWFNRKGIDICTFHAPDARMTSPALVQDILAGFDWLMPYYRYFKALELEPPVTDPIR